MITKVLDWLRSRRPRHDLHDHGHTHGIVDPTITTTSRGIWAIKWSFLILAVTAALQLVVVFVAAIALILVGSPPTFAESTCGNLPSLTEGSSKDVKVDYLMRRAFACVQEGKPALSVEIFSEIISIDPENEAAYLNRGSAYLQTGQPDLAIADFQQSHQF